MKTWINKTVYDALGREPVHPFPARMAPGIALDIISKAPRNSTILDPMMGSGTVVALAHSKRHKAIGIDIDPLAVLMARVWTTVANKERIRAESQSVLSCAKKISRVLLAKRAYPPNSDDETRRFISYWFDFRARKQLTSLAISINRVKHRNTRNVLWCAFSRMIISKQSGVSLAMDLSHSRPHKKFRRGPVEPFAKFLVMVDRVLSDCVDKAAGPFGPAPRILLADARKLPVAENSVDLVLTSPPYLNAIDYLRCSKFSLVWMGYRISELRKIRRDSVGSEVAANSSGHVATVSNAVLKTLRVTSKLSNRHQGILKRYVQDILTSMCEASRTLVANGKAVYVIGENTIRGTYIRNSAILKEAGRISGLILRAKYVRNLPSNRRYLPPPSSVHSRVALGRRMRREVVLVFSKAA